MARRVRPGLSRRVEGPGEERGDLVDGARRAGGGRRPEKRSGEGGERGARRTSVSSRGERVQLPARRPSPRVTRPGTGSNLPPRGARGRDPARLLRGPRPPRGGRNGRGLPRPRRAARPRGRRQGPRRRVPLGPGAAPALHRRGAHRVVAEPPEHRHDLRGRAGRRPAVPRDGARRREDPPPPRRGRPPPHAEGPRRDGPGRRGALRCARGEPRPPRPQAGERHGLPRRVREDPRLRPRQAVRGRGLGRAGPRPGEDVDGNRRRDGELHVPRAGARTPRGLPLRPVLLRADPLRAPDRPEGVRQGERRPDAHGDHRGGARVHRAAEPEDPDPPRLDRRALPLEGARGPLRRHARPRPRDAAGPRPPRPPDRRRARGATGRDPGRAGRRRDDPGERGRPRADRRHGRAAHRPRLPRAAATGRAASSPPRSARSRSSRPAPGSAGGSGT